MKKGKKKGNTVEAVDKPRTVGMPWEGEEVTPEKIDAMNALAAVLFEGQSKSAPLADMLINIKPKLIDKGYGNCLDKLVIPVG